MALVESDHPPLSSLGIDLLGGLLGICVLHLAASASFTHVAHLPITSAVTNRPCSCTDPCSTYQEARMVGGGRGRGGGKGEKTDNPDSHRARPQTLPHPSLSLNDDRRQIRRKHKPITAIPARAEPSCSKPKF